MGNGFHLRQTAKIRKIAFVGDHLPRKCGIATFTYRFALGGTAAVSGEPVPVRFR